MPIPRQREAEVIVIGGGPAGSTVAADLALAGHRVLLLDRAGFPRHKPCSDYVNPAGVRLLDEIGAGEEIRRAGAHQMAAMLVHAPSGRRFVVDFARAAWPAALGLSRFRLDHLLLERAKAAGVDVRERAHVRQVIQEGGRVTGVVATIDGTREEIRASLVIGADGSRSVIARDLGLEVVHRWPSKTGLVAHYRGVTGLGDTGELHVAARAYAGLAPLEDGLANVAVVAPGRLVATRTGPVAEFFEATLRSMPAVAAKLAEAERVGAIRGVGAMARRARRTAGDGYLLVGDAASFLDPFTGDGVYEALRGARLAAPVASRALSAGDVSAHALAPYRIARRRAFTAKRELTWLIQGFISLPPLMNYVTERLARRDELGLTLSGVLANVVPASAALSPVFLARVLRP